MLIEVVNLSSIKNAAGRRALSNLLNAHFLGFHKLLIDEAPENFDYTVFDYLSEFELEALHNVIDGYSEAAQITSIIKLKAIIDFASHGNTFKVNASFTEIYIPYPALINLQNLSPTILIFEDESEENFYKNMIAIADKALLFDMKFINYELVPGSGGQSFNIFDRRRRLKRPVLCVVDSDKKHPSGGRGTTSGAFPSEKEKIEYWSKYIVLECHEIENLVPLELYKEIVFDRRSNLCIDILYKLRDRGNDSYRKYMDFKQGVSCDKANEYDNGRAAFWLRDELSRVHCEVCASCRSNPSLEADENSYCERYIIPPFGNNAMDKVATYFTENNVHRIRQKLGRLENSELEHILINIRDWCFAYPPISCA